MGHGRDLGAQTRVSYIFRHISALHGQYVCSVGAAGLDGPKINSFSTELRTSPPNLFPDSLSSFFTLCRCLPSFSPKSFQNVQVHILNYEQGGEKEMLVQRLKDVREEEKSNG